MTGMSRLLFAAQGQREEAQREIDRAAPLSARSEVHSVRFNVALAAGRVHAAAARFPEAAESFHTALVEARHAGIYGAALDALGDSQSACRKGIRGTSSS